MVVPRARSQELGDVITLGVIAALIGTVGPRINIWLWRVLAAEPGSAGTGPPQALTVGTRPVIGLDILQPQPGALLLTCGLLIGLGLFITSYHTLAKPPASQRMQSTDEAEPSTDHDAPQTHESD